MQWCNGVQVRNFKKMFDVTDVVDDVQDVVDDTVQRTTDNLSQVPAKDIIYLKTVS